MENALGGAELRKFGAQFKSKLKAIPPMKTIEAKLRRRAERNHGAETTAPTRRRAIRTSARSHAGRQRRRYPVLSLWVWMTPPRSRRTL